MESQIFGVGEDDFFREKYFIWVENGPYEEEVQEEEEEPLDGEETWEEWMLRWEESR